MAEWIGVCIDAVSEFWSSQKEKQHQERRKTQASDEGEKGVKWPWRSVHVAVDIAGNNQYRQLSDEEANNHQAQHGPNGLPRRRGSPYSEAVRRWRQWNTIEHHWTHVWLHTVHH